MLLAVICHKQDVDNNKRYKTLKKVAKHAIRMDISMKNMLCNVAKLHMVMYDVDITLCNVISMAIQFRAH